MRWHNITYSLRTAALLLSCFFVVAACENDQQEIDNLFTRKVMLEEAHQIESYYSDAGLVKAKLTAPLMLRRQQDSAYMEFPKTLHVDFYDDSTRIETILDARYAKYYEYDRKILLRDSVVVINIRTGDTLRTPELWWDQNKQEFYTNKPSHIHKPTERIFARSGLRAAQNLSWYDFYDASGQVQTPNDILPQ
jgi:LPS export ABC transporter protein LptC